MTVDGKFLLAVSTLFGLAFLATSAQAQNSPRNVEAGAMPLSESITYSEPGSDVKPKTPALVSKVAYLVTITNSSGNTINKVRYEPEWSAVTVEENPQPLATAFLEDDGSPCKLDASGKQGVVCTLGQFQAQSPTATFPIFFKAPDKPSPYFVGQMKLGGTVWFAEGTNDTQNNPNSSALLEQKAPLRLGTSNPKEVRSGVGKKGGAIFTGSGGVPSATDLNASLLSVPSLPDASKYAFARLLESEPGDSDFSCPTTAACLANFAVTVADKDAADGTKLTFNPTGVTAENREEKYLVITLLRDDTLFTGNIGRVTIYYEPSPGAGWVTVDACAQVPDPLGAVTSPSRCVLDRKVLQNSDQEVKDNPALKGVAQIKILAKDNGRLSW